MYRMEKTVIIQETEKVLARIEVDAFDNRTQKTETLVIFTELVNEEQPASDVAKKALKELGYLYQGVKDVETTTVPFDAEGFYYAGKDREAEEMESK